MAVIGPVVSPFETDEEGILVVPGGAEERDIDSPEELIKRRRRLSGRAAGGPAAQRRWKIPAQSPMYRLSCSA